MPITIDEVVERGKQRKQLLTLAEKQEIADQARGIGQQGQWEELAQELHASPRHQKWPSVCALKPSQQHLPGTPQDKRLWP